MSAKENNHIDCESQLALEAIVMSQQSVNVTSGQTVSPKQ